MPNPERSNSGPQKLLPISEFVSNQDSSVVSMREPVAGEDRKGKCGQLGRKILVPNFSEWEKQWPGRDRYKALEEKGDKRTTEDNQEFETLRVEKKSKKHVFSQRESMDRKKRKLAELKLEKGELEKGELEKGGSEDKKKLEGQIQELELQGREKKKNDFLARQEQKVREKRTEQLAELKLEKEKLKKGGSEDKKKLEGQIQELESIIGYDNFYKSKRQNKIQGIFEALERKGEKRDSEENQEFEYLKGRIKYRDSYLADYTTKLAEKEGRIDPPLNTTGDRGHSFPVSLEEQLSGLEQQYGFGGGVKQEYRGGGSTNFTDGATQNLVRDGGTEWIDPSLGYAPVFPVAEQPYVLDQQGRFGGEAGQWYGEGGSTNFTDGATQNLVRDGGAEWIDPSLGHVPVFPVAEQLFRGGGFGDSHDLRTVNNVTIFGDVIFPSLDDQEGK
jgi:hypothetical protein